MGYMKIPNLYKDQRLLCFNTLYATEKVHGTSAHLRWDGERIHLFSGGEKHERLAEVFDFGVLTERFHDVVGAKPCKVYGESYGGKMQGMRESYGDAVAFTAFEVGFPGDGHEVFLDVERAADLVAQLGLEFMPFVKLVAESRAEMVALLDAERDRTALVSEMRGVEGYRMREGIVIRPPFEVRLNSGGRLIAKHKRPEFSETKTKRVLDPAKQEVLRQATAIAAEWVTPMRLEHVVGALTLDGVEPGIERTGDVVKAMVDDVVVEGEGEFVDSRDARKAIGKRAAQMFRERLRGRCRCKTARIAAPGSRTAARGHASASSRTTGCRC